MTQAQAIALQQLRRAQSSLQRAEAEGHWSDITRLEDEIVTLQALVPVGAEHVTLGVSF
jgi:hypothetical protein